MLRQKPETAGHCITQALAPHKELGSNEWMAMTYAHFGRFAKMRGDWGMALWLWVKRLHFKIGLYRPLDHTVLA